MMNRLQTLLSNSTCAAKLRQRRDLDGQVVEAGRVHVGKAVQAEPMKPTLKAPGSKRLKLKSDEPRSNVDFNCNVRRYMWVVNFSIFGVIGMMWWKFIGLW
jgi:hypothetical protein